MATFSAASKTEGTTTPYLAYLPGFWIFGWTGQWDSLPAAHATTILWDLLALVGLALVGWRLGGPEDGPRLCREFIYFATVLAETVNPSLASSAWIRF